MANPYMLFTAYERSAFAELLAAAFLPLLLEAALAERVQVLAMAGFVALLWLTNAPAAVMGMYALAFITIVRLTTESWSKRGERAGKVLVATGEGAGLVSFYLLPAAYEQRYVQINMAVIQGMRVQDHFLFHRMPGGTPDDLFHDAVVRTASIVSLILLGGIGVAFLAIRRRGGKLPAPVLPLGLLAVVIGFLLTPLSGPVWAVLPKLKFLQFPWRLSALLGAIFALFVGLALERFFEDRKKGETRGPTRWLSNLGHPGWVVGLAVAMIVPAWMVFRQSCDEEDSVPARVALFHSNLGTEATDEYTPVGADGDALHPHDPPYWLLPSNADVNAPASVGVDPGPAPDHLRLRVLAPELLVLNRREYPAWQIRVNGVVTPPATPERDDGLITVSVPQGSDTVDLQWVWLPDEEIGFGITGVSVLFAIGYWRLGSRTKAA